MRLLLVIQKGASKNATNSSSEEGVQRASMRKRRCAEQRRSARSSSEVKPTDMHDRSWEVLKAACTGDAAVEEAAEAAGAEESAEAVGAAEAAEAAGATPAAPPAVASLLEVAVEAEEARREAEDQLQLEVQLVCL
jgi:hypothetical protein